MSMAGDDVETDGVQVLHDRRGVHDIPEHSEAVSSGPHVQDPEDPAAVTKMDVALSQVEIVSSIAGAECEARGSTANGIVNPVSREAY